MDNRAERPDVDLVRVRVARCPELPREYPELLWGPINSRAAVGLQRCTDPALGDAEVGDLHPYGREGGDCRDGVHQMQVKT